ncbi:MAG TPA: cytochrome P450 [Pseudonocardiaceae bacterium]|nr:cytochrome P450 [Pseudonocardiaceae bacterium]
MTSTRSTYEDFLTWLQERRAHGQVHFDDKQRCWQVLGHPEANAILADPARFSPDLSALMPNQEDFALFQRGNFVRMDPPQHRKLRSLVSQAFTPKIVAALEPRIAKLTIRLLDQAGERFDLIDALAYPLPVIVIADLLGIPTSDQALFRAWADVLFSQERDPDQAIDQVGEELIAAVVPTMREMNAYFLDYIRSRRANPGQDLTSKLVAAEVDGEHLTDHDIVGFVGLLLLAGHITTTATLGNSLVTFQDNPPRSPRSGPIRRCCQRRSRRSFGFARRSRTGQAVPGRWSPSPDCRWRYAPPDQLRQGGGWSDQASRTAQSAGRPLQSPGCYASLTRPPAAALDPGGDCCIEGRRRSA